MAERYQVSSPQMQKDAEEMHALAMEIPKQIRALEDSMQMLHACWKGSARNTFQGQVIQDVAYMNEVYRFLTEYIEKMSNSGDTYFEAEYKAYQAANRLWI